MSETKVRAEVVLELFDKYYERVYCFVRKSLPAEQAQDIVQEVFIRLLEHRNLERMTLSVSYLIKIADNLMKRRYARQKRFGRYLESATNGTDPVEAALAALPVQAIDAQELGRAMESLTGGERDAVSLIICQGMSYEDAARSLGVNVSTINNWKYRGLQKLKQSATPAADERTARQPGSSRSLHGRGDREQAAGARPSARGNRVGFEPDGARRVHRKVCSF